MLIWRVEDKDGNGPYRNASPPMRDILGWEDDGFLGVGYMEDPCHPTPAHDMLGLIGYCAKIGWVKVKFGFQSYHCLNHWFSDWQLREMGKIGYDARVYELCPIYVRLGIHQCIFDAGNVLGLRQIVALRNLCASGRLAAR